MTHKILLADDSVTIRKVVELTFADEDVSLVPVGDGATALQAARSERPDLILSDVIMPAMNGYELCRQVKQDPQLRTIPFVFLRGTFEPFDEDKARACGADGFIVKPFESQDMIRRVKEFIAAGGSPAPAAAAAPAAPPAEAPAPAPPPRVLAPSPAPVPAPPPVPVPAPPPPAAALAAAPARPPEPPLVSAPPPPPVPPPPPPAVIAAPAVAEALVSVTEDFAAVAEELPAAPPTLAAVPPPAAPPAPPPAPWPPERVVFEDVVEEAPPFPEAAAPERAPAAPAPAAAPEEAEDLWSEVSLRDRAGAPALEEKALEEDAFWGSGEAFGEPREPAPEPEDVFEEVTTARREPIVPPPAAARPFAPPAPAAPPEPAAVALEEPLEEAVVLEAEPVAEPVAAAPSAVEPRESPAAAVAAISPGDLERIVGERLEAVVRQVLAPVATELARRIVEEVAWDVVPELAEAMIKSEIDRVRRETGSA